MRVVVLGAGGVGSVVAGYLARAGFDVIMLARPGHAAKVQQEGLLVTGLEKFDAAHLHMCYSRQCACHVLGFDGDN